MSIVERRTTNRYLHDHGLPITGSSCLHWSVIDDWTWRYGQSWDAQRGCQHQFLAFFIQLKRYLEGICHENHEIHETGRFLPPVLSSSSYLGIKLGLEPAYWSADELDLHESFEREATRTLR